MTENNFKGDFKTNEDSKKDPGFKQGLKSKFYFTRIFLNT